MLKACTIENGNLVEHSIIHSKYNVHVCSVDGRIMCVYEDLTATITKSVLGHKVIIPDGRHISSSMSAEIALVLTDPEKMKDTLRFFDAAGFKVHSDAMTTAKKIVNAVDYTVDKFNASGSDVWIERNYIINDKGATITIAICGSISSCFRNRSIFVLESVISETGHTKFKIVDKKCLEGSMEETISRLRDIASRENKKRVKYAVEGNYNESAISSGKIKVCNNAIAMLLALIGE